MITSGKCNNCGASKELHHYKTTQCPVGGREAPVGQKQEWKETRYVEIEANQAISREALAVYNETGYSPRQLAEQKAGLLAACEDTRGIIDAGYAMKYISAPKNYHVQLDLALKQLTAAIAAATTW